MTNTIRMIKNNKRRAGLPVSNCADPRYDTDYISRAKTLVKACRNIPDFAFWGKDDSGDPLPLGETWAFTVATNRDADILTESNYDVITTDMCKRFPRSTRKDNCNHWACGWVEYLTVRMLDSRGRVTMAGIAIIDWLDKLADYPVANEDDYSRREYEAYSESMRESAKWVLQRDPDTTIADNTPADYLDTLIDTWRNEYPHDYDVAWDHEGWIEDRPSYRDDFGALHLVEVATRLGFVVPLI